MAVWCMRIWRETLAATARPCKARRCPEWKLTEPRPLLRYPSLGMAPATHEQAEYVQGERAIRFHWADDPALFVHVLYHEIGHHVFYLVLDSRAKKDWVTRVYPGSVCATPYGMVSPAEDFAEC